MSHLLMSHVAQVYEMAGYTPKQMLLRRIAPLHHIAPHCTTLPHTTTHCYCNTLQHAVIHCTILQHTASHCNTLQHTATHCNTLQKTAHTPNQMLIVHTIHAGDAVWGVFGGIFFVGDISRHVTHVTHVTHVNNPVTQGNETLGS